MARIRNAPMCLWHSAKNRKRFRQISSAMNKVECSSTTMKSRHTCIVCKCKLGIMVAFIFYSATHPRPTTANMFCISLPNQMRSKSQVQLIVPYMVMGVECSFFFTPICPRCSYERRVSYYLFKHFRQCNPHMLHNMTVFIY